jgi:hypothetical protein
VEERREVEVGFQDRVEFMFRKVMAENPEADEVVIRKQVVDQVKREVTLEKNAQVATDAGINKDKDGKLAIHNLLQSGLIKKGM